jgi:dolichyl-phosphate beta-glucosyltransferase
LKRPELSIVIPVYNEESRLPKTFRESLDYLKKSKIRYEILIVDDGSRDGTLKEVELFRRKVGKGACKLLRQEQNQGKGAAVKRGALEAQGEIVLFMDADNATPLNQFDRLRPLFAKGFDVVVGSRAVDRSMVKVHQPLYREAMGRFFNILVQLAATPGIQDTQCGFKAFRRKAAQAVFPLQTIDRFGFDVEILFIARKQGWSMVEAPVEWFDAPGSKVHVIRDSLTMFLDLALIRFNEIKGLYRPKTKE